MAQYLFVHIKSGKRAEVPEDKLEETLLEICGGGYTEAQVAMAMVYRAELTSGTNEMVRTASFEITPIL